MNKEYLGDGAYAEVDEDGRLVLTTENGLRATNTIYFEPDTLAALLAYIDRRKQEVQDEMARRLVENT